MRSYGTSGEIEALLCLNVNPAFELLAVPAAGARVCGIEGQFGARRAADAGVALFVKRQLRNLVRGEVFPNLAIGPHRQRTDLLYFFAAGELELLDDLQVR